MSKRTQPCGLWLALSVLILSTGLGCSKSSKPPTPTVEVLASLCDAEGECARGQRCSAGFCVDDDCHAGTLDCGCHHDGTCDAIEGAPLSCKQNICQETEEPERGALGAACSDADPCDATLRCVSGQCEEPACPSGELDCPCGPYGHCGDYAGTPVRCGPQDRCVVGQCEPGTAGCACDSDGNCDGGLECQEGRCLQPEFELRVPDARARACDVVLETAANASIARVRFSGAVYGHQHSRSPRMALSFFLAEDAPLEEPVVRLETSGDHNTEPPAIEASECFDHEGRRLRDVELTWQ